MRLDLSLKCSKYRLLEDAEIEMSKKYYRDIIVAQKAKPGFLDPNKFILPAGTIITITRWCEKGGYCDSNIVVMKKDNPKHPFATVLLVRDDLMRARLEVERL